MLTDEQLAEAKARIARAHTEVGEIASQGAHRRWRMSIPAQPDRDSDLIVSAALKDAETLLAEVKRLSEDVAELEPFRPQPMSQRCRDGHHNGVGDMRCINCYCLCHNRDEEVRQLTEDRDRAVRERDSLVRRLNARYGELSQARAERDEVKDTLDATMLRFEEYIEEHTARGGCQPVDEDGAGC